jgi:MoaA/NifB/PqqE/SkfB family radical SAM enzyme
MNQIKDKSEINYFKNIFYLVWNIHYACNYRCPYCWWYGKWQNLAKLNRYLSVEEWTKYWSNIYNKYGCVRIEVSGGEPFIYPNFKELVLELSKMHTLVITTNLSTDIGDFTEQINSEKVKIIPSFHPLFVDFYTFIKKARLLKEKGFTTDVHYLAYPPQIKYLGLYKEKFESAGLVFSVLIFWGNYNGINYPEGYTEEERNFIHSCLDYCAQEKFQVIAERERKGSLCQAGHYYAVIQGDGRVVRCEGSDLNEEVGNFFDKNFKLLDKALPCNTEPCNCNERFFLIENNRPRKKYGPDDEVKVSELSDGEAISTQHGLLLRDTEQSNALAENESKKIREKFLKNREKSIQETRERKIILDSKPLRLGLVATNWCNLRCIMCPQARHSNELTFTPEIVTKIKEIIPYVKKVQWQGGEFFHLDYFKDFFYSLQKFTHITHEIITNGLLLNKDWIELLLNLDVTMSFSIDSPIKETYEYIRNGASYNKLIECLALIAELEQNSGRKLRRHITAVVMKSNYRHLDNFIPFVKEYGFGGICFNPVKFIENEENIFKDQNFDSQYFSEVSSYMKDKFFEMGVDFIWNLPDTHIKTNSNPINSLGNNGLYCHFPWKSIFIDASRNGDIFPECWCEEPIGNIFCDNLLEVWNNERAQEYRKKIIAGYFSGCNKECLLGQNPWIAFDKVT